MKISSANNLPEEQSGPSQGSFIDTNSISGDSDLDAASAAGDQNQIIEELKKTIKENQSQISELEGRLKVTEIQLQCQKDKINLYEVIVKDKDDVIRVLQNSIDLITKTSELAIKQLQKSEAEVVTSYNANNLEKENDSLESIDEIKSKVKENNVDNFGAQELQESKCQAKEDSADSHEVDDNLEKFQEQLDKCKEQNESLELTELKVELDELKSKMIESQKIEDGLRKQVSELENNFLSVSAKLKESSEKLAEFKLYSDSFPDKQEIVLLNNTKNPKLKVIERDGLEPFISVIEDIPSAWSSGWIVIQRRIDASYVLHESETAFEKGFGDTNASFWLGLNLIHELTTSQRHELYIQIVDRNNVTAYARYDHFEVGSKEEKYKIKSLGSYSGNAGDAFRSFENAPIMFYGFTRNCHSWWEATPTNCNLNCTGLYWSRLSLGRNECRLKSCQMLIRPKTK